MNSPEKIVTITPPKQTAEELRTSLAAAKEEHGKLERAHAAAPSEKRWAFVRDARERRDALASRLQIAEAEVKETADRQLREERAERLRAFKVHEEYIQRGHEAELEPLVERLAERIIAIELEEGESGIFAHLAELQRRSFEAAERARGLTGTEVGVVENGAPSTSGSRGPGVA